VQEDPEGETREVEGSRYICRRCGCPVCLLGGFVSRTDCDRHD
jgi:hypothetical protein